MYIVIFTKLAYRKTEILCLGDKEVQPDKKGGALRLGRLTSLGLVCMHQATHGLLRIGDDLAYHCRRCCGVCRTALEQTWQNSTDDFQCERKLLETGAVFALISSAIYCNSFDGYKAAETLMSDESQSNIAESARFYLMIGASKSTSWI